jgi:type VI protein secretion system component VasK
VAVLEQVTGPAAPLRRLLETLRDNSVIYPTVPLAEGQAPLKLDKMPEGQQQAAGIRRAFSSLSELITARGEQPSYYEETLRSVSAVYDYAKTVHDNPDPGKAALKTVLNRFSLDGADPIANLQRVAVGLPEPLNQHVKKLADQTSQVLVIAALRELEKRWDSEIYSFYRDRLAGRYPFKASGEDASLEDFEAFFGPQGRLQQFHDQYLNVFLKDNPRRPVLRQPRRLPGTQRRAGTTEKSRAHPRHLLQPSRPLGRATHHRTPGPERHPPEQHAQRRRPTDPLPAWRAATHGAGVAQQPGQHQWQPTDPGAQHRQTPPA